MKLDIGDVSEALEKQKLQEAFKHLDKDKNGSISYDEIVQALKSEGVKDVGSIRQDMVNKLANGIEFEEFYRLIQRYIEHDISPN